MQCFPRLPQQVGYRGILGDYGVFDWVYFFSLFSFYFFIFFIFMVTEELFRVFRRPRCELVANTGDFVRLCNLVGQETD